MQYQLFSPSQIYFGWGRRSEVGSLAHSLGRRAFVVCGSQTLKHEGKLQELFDALTTSQVEPILVGEISQEPEPSHVDETTRIVRSHQPESGDLVIAIGGGSGIDLAKAVSAMATNRQGDSVVDFLEGVGKGLAITQPPLPLLAMPTTGGTGTEATKNAVISSYDPPFKKSLRSNWMVPKIVLVDPELSITVPQATTAYTGMDCITQLIESIISQRAQPIATALAKHGLELAASAIVDVVQDGSQRIPRERMAHAAMLSGMALANSGLGLAHGVAAALGAHCKVAHGLACAVMLPVAMRVNRAVRESEIAQIGSILTKQTYSSPQQAADAALDQVNRWCDDLSIPRRLSELGVAQEQIPQIVASSRGNSMNGNPVPLDDQQLHQLLEEML